MDYLYIVIIAVIVTVAAILGLQISSNHAYQSMIASVSMDGYDACNADCARNFEENYSFKCVEVAPGEFVCREGREAVRLEDGACVGWSGTYPQHYGEILAFSEGQYDRAGFDIAGVKIMDAESGAARIAFAPHHDPTNIAHVATVLPGDMFLAGCTTDENPVHLFRHSGTFERGGILYIELWAAHPVPPPGLVPCDLSKTVEVSLQTDYDIVLPDYEDFGFGQ